MKKTALSRLWAFFGAFMMTHLFSIPAFAKGEAVIGQPYDGEIEFQPAASPVKAEMIHFHDSILLPLITVISAFVMFLLLFVMLRFNAKANPVPSKTTHNTMLEIVWTLVPVVILVLIVIPSMQLLYKADRTHEADMTLKVTGNQWYWSYEYPDHGGFTFSSNLVPDNKLNGRPRLLATDNPVVLPINTNIRILVTGSDVIHSWAVPAFGVKMDGNPGKLNETWARIEQEGTFYGQCSELCGQGHGFMPIEVRAVKKEEFAKWVHSQGGKMPEEQTKAAANAPTPDAAAKGEAKAAAKPADASKKEEEKAGEK